MTLSPTSAITRTRDAKQVTFELNKQSVLYWRRTLLLRYFVDLGQDSQINIEWEDSDKKKNVLLLKDEEKPFIEKLPHSDLFKSTVKVSFKSVKVITITIYYTTQKCLVQGNTCQEWTNEEFGKIKTLVDQCLKGGNPKCTIDSEIRKVALPSISGVMLRNTSVDDLDTSETLPKTVDDAETVPKILNDNQNGKSSKVSNDLMTPLQRQHVNKVHRKKLCTTQKIA